MNVTLFPYRQSTVCHLLVIWKYQPLLDLRCLSRAKLAEVILESSAGQSAELCTRCYPPTLSMWETSSQLNGLKCLATAALACSSCRDKEQLPSLKSYHDFCRKPDVRTTLQRCVLSSMFVCRSFLKGSSLLFERCSTALLFCGADGCIKIQAI